MIRVAAVGGASTGKSALLNALFGTRFVVDPRARSTAAPSRADGRFGALEVEAVDTPPLENNPGYMDADAYLLVCDKDLVDAEYREVLRIHQARRPVAVAINKADLYSAAQRRQLLQQIRRRLDAVVPAERVACCAADPVRLTHRHGHDGEVIEEHLEVAPDLRTLIPVVHDLLSEAENSIRVRTRELGARTRDLATQASSRIAVWLKERNK